MIALRAVFYVLVLLVTGYLVGAASVAQLQSWMSTLPIGG
jgi:hypothetical protein